MIERFVDTSGWAESADRTLSYHRKAVALLDEVWAGGGRLVTTSLVLLELSALLNRPLRMPKTMQIQLLDRIRADKSVDVVQVDLRLESAAWSLWRSRIDKKWSVVDCASFVVMRELGLTEAVTSDHHFERAGFVKLIATT